ncbi:MAG TPA: CotD family spore coat protein [Pseudogracilibacillus sp.]|nr:CotD family spore coat protein [Pseudogracilibacillus sp.]
MGKKHCHCKGKCQCDRKIVYPTKEEVKNIYTEETVDHIHPSHTTVVNNHTVRNVHSYPHSTSHETRVREIDVRGAQDRPGASGNNVAGVTDNGYGQVQGQFDGRRCKRCCRSRCCCRERRRGYWW